MVANSLNMLKSSAKLRDLAFVGYHIILLFLQSDAAKSIFMTLTVQKVFNGIIINKNEWIRSA